ncbi:MAG TPA: sulfite exporter TauE/SafE family protein [Thermoleophilaceae bacterium]|nr:sulfite exporter TauE/SafE family protein [Thermoleophilaceae bacterium]
MRARIFLATLLLTLAAAGPAAAHPLGNFSVNHLSTVSISSDRVDVRYVLDQAEIPTVQERGLDRSEVLRRKLDEVRDRLVLTVNGRRAMLRAVGRPRLTFPQGAGGLPTTRLELTLGAAVRRPRGVELHDGTFPGRIGWKAIVAAPGERTEVRTKASTGDPTNELRAYPKDLLKSPLDERDAAFSVTPGSGTVNGRAGTKVHTASPDQARSDGLTGLFDDAAAGRGVLALVLLAAFGWGALHALSPGHGKGMVAAYLVGTRGSASDAVVLGATVTITHTIGVFALGLVTLALSQYVLPEQLYPWLTLLSGLLVVVLGAGVLRSRLRRAHKHTHHHHTHTHDRRSLLGMGAAAGLLPCPSALVVLLAAISQHELALGLLLIVAFSLGLAGTLTGLGLAVVHARRFLPPRVAAGRLAAVMPAVSAALVMTLGLVLAARAVPDVM